MTETHELARFDRAAEAADAAIAGIKIEQFGEPSPCSEWTVRQVVNHVVGGNKFFISTATGGGPVDRDSDHLGGDPSAAFRESTARLREIFAMDGALDRVVATPFGDRPVRILVEMRVNEMMLHGWDVAKATGQSTDLDPELAEECIESLRQMRASGRGAGMFADAQPVADDAPPADRLAALAGRRTT